jgi:PhnB protein
MAEKISRIPRDYRSITPTLTITGASEAIEYYRKVFGAEVLSRLDRPDGKLMHAELMIGDSIIMLGEECPPHEGHGENCTSSPTNLKGSTVGLYLYVDDVDSVVRRAVKAGGQAGMEVADMFWGDRAGTVKDPFGHIWMVATHKRDLSPEEVRKGAEEFCTQMAGKH